MHSLRTLIAAFSIGTCVASPLTEDQILSLVKETYPPLLISQIENKLAQANKQYSKGAFDTTLSVSGQIRPSNYYDGSNYELLLSSPFENSGAELYGGYRLSNGYLPTYKRDLRTGDSGEYVVGFSFPLLQNFQIDNRRAQLKKASINESLTKHIVDLQLIELSRAARTAYYGWIIAAQKESTAIELKELALTRQSLLSKEVEAGARPEIILIDNQRIVLNRDILVRQAQRDLLNSNLSLGLFTPSLSLDPSILPSTPPRIPLVTQNQFQSDLSYAMETHPEVLSLNQRQKSNQVDQELAQNMLLPQLDLTAELNRSVREDSPKDIERNEIVAGLSLTFPLARNQAKGQLKTAKQTQQQLSLKKQFALSKLNADLNTAYNNLQTNYKAWHLTEESQTLALKLYKAEESLFDEGASDLLKLQIRENALVDAKMATLKSLYQYLSSYSDYIAITARDLQ